MKGTKINMVKTNQGLKPAYDSDLEKYQKLPKDWEGEVVLRVPRNYEFLKKYMALIKLGFENSESDNKDTYRYLKQMEAGYFKVETRQKDGYKIHLPVSISFENMTEQEFSELYDKVLTVISNDLSTAPKDVEAELNSFY